MLCDRLTRLAGSTLARYFNGRAAKTPGVFSSSKTPGVFPSCLDNLPVKIFQASFSTAINPAGWCVVVQEAVLANYRSWEANISLAPRLSDHAS